MKNIYKTLAVSLSLALMVSLGLSGPAVADRKRAQNTMTGAVVGTGVGFLVGGNKGAAAGAVVGAIGGYVK